jgi:hypothetical protein
MPYKVLITSKNYPEGHWLDVTTCTQKEFLSSVENLFGKEDSQFFVEDIDEMIPFEFHHAGVGRQILTDRFWDWRDYSKEDQELLVRYMEITSEDSVTLEEAKKYFHTIGIHHKDLHFKDGRVLYHYFMETGRSNCTLKEAKDYYNNLAGS